MRIQGDEKQIMYWVNKYSNTSGIVFEKCNKCKKRVPMKNGSFKKGSFYCHKCNSNEMKNLI